MFVTLSFHPKKVVPPLFHVCVASITGVLAVTVPPDSEAVPVTAKVLGVIEATTEPLLENPNVLAAERKMPVSGSPAKVYPGAAAELDAAARTTPFR